MGLGTGQAVLSVDWPCYAAVFKLVGCDVTRRSCCASVAVAMHDYGAVVIVLATDA